MKQKPFLEKNEKQRYTLGVVYEPDTLDTDNEFSTAEEIEKACWGFMLHIQSENDTAKLAKSLLEQVVDAAKKDAEVRLDVTDLLATTTEKRGVGSMHEEMLPDCRVVECYLAPQDLVVQGQAVKKGAWMLGVVWNEEQFAKIQGGERTGYSMGGTARKE
jgi:hypothetical protein